MRIAFQNHGGVRAHEAKWHSLGLVAGVLVGCASQHTAPVSRIAPQPVDAGHFFHGFRTAEQFAFLKEGLPISVVTLRVGLPDRELGSGQLRWEYDLADGSVVVIIPNTSDFKDITTWKVSSFGLLRDTRWL